MKKEEFIQLYNSCSLVELKEILKCSIPTIYKRINEYGIKKKGRGVGKRMYRKLDLE